MKKLATSWSKTFDATNPSWIHALVEETDIGDETDKFNWGFETNRSFKQLKIGETRSSGWSEFPN